MEHIRSKPVSDSGIFFRSLAGFAVALLVTLGAGGTVYNLVVPGGWISKIFGSSLAGGMAPVLGLLIIAICAWLPRTWVSIGARNRHSELLVYGFAVAGALYALEFLLKGGL